MNKRIITTVLAIVMTLLVLCIAAPGVAAEDEQKFLTVEDCVQISDTQIIVKFSEPIAVNLHDSNRGPWIALRIVNTQNILQYDKTQPLHWQGNCTFVGSEHDTMMFEFGSANTTTISDIVNFRGDYAQYYKDGLMVDLCIEEVPYDQTKAAHDGFLDNVTTIDGETRLWGNAPYGWDGVYMPIRVDYNYDIDLSVVEPLSIIDDFEYGTIFSIVEKEEVEPIVETVVVKQNDYTFMALVIGCGVVAAVALYFGLKAITRKAGKKA